MIVELRLLIVDVKNWRSGATSFNNQQSTIINHQSSIVNLFSVV
jgi:hypothetical protein